MNQINTLDALKDWMMARRLQSSSVDSSTLDQVSKIRDDVVAKGDDALCDFTNQFDRVTLLPDQIQVTPAAIQSAYQSVSDTIISALTHAADNIRAYHRHQCPSDWSDARSDHEYGVQYSPIDSVGLYVPGGRAVYPSSVLMTAIPAVIAGSSRIVMVSPPTGGCISPVVLAAAQIAGVTDVYQVGGAQAVFGLAYGTPRVPCVDKIVGPGNRFVTAAKQLVYGMVDIDKPAGPSEVCVYVDDEAYAGYAAADMWAQLEHDPDASAICIATSSAIALAVKRHAEMQRPQLTRQAIFSESVNNAVIMVTSTQEEALSAINYCASEHLVLISDRADMLRPMVRHAGSIFCGPYTPVTLGDYYAGPNHVLPTARSARFASPLGVMDFMKYSSHLTYTQSALHRVAHDIDVLTQAEGFDAHNHAVTVRLNEHG